MLWVWVGFILFIFTMLALDLGVFHRHAHAVKVKEALAWTAGWVSLAMLFGVFVYFAYQQHWFGLGLEVDPVDGRSNDGRSAVLKFFTGYVVEESLSVDNVFVMAVLFRYFAVPAIYQHRVLFWGILGAVAMRGTMIVVGARLIEEFHWVLYIFGALLVVTAIKMLFLHSEDIDPDRNVVVRLTRRFFPVTRNYHAGRFIVRAGDAASQAPPVPGEPMVPDPAVAATRPGTLMLTPLALALVMVETTDLVFAVDSIPAIFAITADPFLVFTSNVFAILGLRSLYFALAGMMEKFRFLKVSLAAVLMLVGVKMLVADWLKDFMGPHFNAYLLGVVVLVLATGVAASWLVPNRVASHEPGA